MEPLFENNAGQLNDAAAKPSLGTMLREARERLGLSVGDVAGQIKFAPRQIEALESGDYQHLPEPAFVRGFVRSYAKILHLDAQTLLAALPPPKPVAATALSPAAVGVAFPSGHAAQQQNLIWLGAALALSVIVVGFAVWHFTSPARPAPGKQAIDQNKAAKVEIPVVLPNEVQNPSAALDLKQSEPPLPAPDESKAQPASAPKQNPLQQTQAKPAQAGSVQVPQASAQPAAGSASPKMTLAEPKSQTTDAATQTGPAQAIIELRLLFGVESWTEIKDKDGKTLSARVHASGSEMRLRKSSPLLLVIGHASSVQLFKNGEPVELAPYINSSSDVARLTLE